MKTTKRYKLLLLLPFFLSLPGLASDSLKVKKTEYYEDGKLVRATFFDSLGRITKQFYINYQENFIEKAKNEIQIVKFKEGKHFCFENYNVNIYGDSVLFYNPDYGGTKQYVKYNSKGQFIETPYVFLKQKWNYYQKMILIDSIEFVNEIETGFNLKILFYYDSLGNEIMQKAIDHGKVNKIVLKKYNTEGKLLTYESNVKEIKERVVLNYTYGITNYFTETYLFIKKELIKKTNEKVFDNEQKQELRKETYQIPLKNSKPIGEPKLTFTQENIYENDGVPPNRIVKIIYEDLLLGKKKIHELKYEFY